MFHLLETSNITIYKTQLAKVNFLLPLGANRLVLINDDSTLGLYNLASHKLIKQIKLPGNVRRAISLNEHSVAILVPSMQSLYEINVDESKGFEVKSIHKFQSTTHRLMPKNPLKENEYYSTMLMEPFMVSGHFFLREESTQFRKFALRSFFKKEQSSKWISHLKDQGINSRKVTKFNEVDKLVLYKDSDIERNGTFQLKIFNIVTQQQEQITLQSQSFNDFTIVVQVKEHENCIFVQVNRKDPQLICFKNRMENTSQFVKSNVLWMVNLGPFILDLSYSMKNFQNLQLTFRKGLLALDSVQGKFQNKSINKQGLMVEYQRQKSVTSITNLRTHRLVGKNKLYLKLLTSGFPKAGATGYLFKDVLALLEP